MHWWERAKGAEVVSSRSSVDAYLTELTAAAVGLPPSRRAELVSEVREHIETALGGRVPPDAVAVRNVLERLGSPAEIVAAEQDEAGPATWVTPTAGRTGLTLVRIAIASLTGIVLLLLAGITGFFGPSAALVALAVALTTPYVWIPLVLVLPGLAWQRDRGARSVAADATVTTGRVARRRISPSLVGLAAAALALLVALVAGGAFSMGMVAVALLPILMVMLVLEVLRDRGR